MKQDVVLIVLEHMRYKLNVHVLDVDLLAPTMSIMYWTWAGCWFTCRLLFRTETASLSFSCSYRSNLEDDLGTRSAYDVRDDSGQQDVLLMLMRVLLQAQAPSVTTQRDSMVRNPPYHTTLILVISFTRLQAAFQIPTPLNAEVQVIDFHMLGACRASQLHQSH